MSMLFRNPTELAIERLRTFEPEEGYYLAYSGGKDSDCILNLARMAGVKFDAHHHLTTCDPPELVRHVKTQPDVEIDRPKETMWQLIRRKKMPPRRQARYCCEVLKEGGGSGRLVVTGIRWGESHRRSKRKMAEHCLRDKSKKFLNPIIDWNTHEVWTFILHHKIEYCSLYDEGFKRLGCVLCPMTRDVKRQMERWPAIARAWERAIKATYEPDIQKRLNGQPDQRCKPKYKSDFKSTEEYWQWWLDRDAVSAKKDDNQMMMFED